MQYQSSVPATGYCGNRMPARAALSAAGNLARFSRLNIRAGVIINGKEMLLPLSADGGGFIFYDQRLSPCSITLMGIDDASTVKVKFSVTTPFRPRDLAFSTTPVLSLRLEASTLGGNFRWSEKSIEVEEVEIFLEFAGPGIEVAASGEDCVDLCFADQHDRLVVTAGSRTGTRFTQKVALGGDAQPLEVAWCTYSAPVLEIHDVRYPFYYAKQFADLDAVAEWARQHPAALRENAMRVDGLIGANTFSQSTNHLLAQTLHAWLIDTWCVDRNGSDWFSVWEGSCYFHSTVDVEYTQAPFYLAVWPELLRSELDFWPEYSKDGTRTLGERGAGTLFLSHDTGNLCAANGQVYPHDMEVEETTNYVILSYAYYQRSADDSIIRKHAKILEQYLAFVAACDTTGTGIPDRGVANTIDDASPAVQFGEEQTYLAVKVLASYAVGAEMLDLLGKDALAARYRQLAEVVRRRIEEAGWQGDHYATLLKKGGRIFDAWQGTTVELEEIPGWDAAHIYTVNGLALLDMIGYDLGLAHDKLVIDLHVATRRCLREYGCVHSDYTPNEAANAVAGLAGASLSPGWISMNMLRDIAAFYRGVDLRYLTDRYWEWQTTTNTQEARVFFETFSGNNLCYYPRGIAIWGYFDALAGRVIDLVRGVDEETPPFPGVQAPRLFDADWAGVRTA